MGTSLGRGVRGVSGRDAGGDERGARRGIGSRTRRKWCGTRANGCGSGRWRSCCSCVCRLERVLFPPPAPGAGWQDKGSQAVEHLTAVGHVRVRRRVWWKKGAGTHAPGDEWLNGGGPRISVGARELCSRIGRQPQGFRKSAGALQRLAGLTVSPERLRQIVEGEGRRMAAARAAGQVPPSWQADEHCVTPNGPSRVYVGVDGVMVPMVTEGEKAKRRATRAGRRRGRHAGGAGRRRRLGRGYRERYKEYKLTLFYDQEKQHRQVAATGGGPEAVGQELRRTGRRLGVERTAEVLAIVDGAPWIRAQLQRWRSCDRIGLDFYHFTEHVAAAANPPRRTASGRGPRRPGPGGNKCCTRRCTRGRTKCWMRSPGSGSKPARRRSGKPCGVCGRTSGNGWR